MRRRSASRRGDGADPRHGEPSDPSRQGAGIAVAFVATILRRRASANLVFLPVAKKLGRHRHLTTQREMLVDGLVGIANGDNPRIIASRMQGYVP